MRSAAAIRSVPPEVRRAALADLASARQKLEGAACSRSWFDECWEYGGTFPPLADTTPMLACRCERCRRQGRVWPAHYSGPDTSSSEPLAAGTRPADPHAILSYDCYLESLDPWTAAQLPSSPSGLAIRAIREGRIRLSRQRTRLGRPQRARPS